MRILITAENMFERKDIRSLLRELRFDAADGTLTLTISEESPSHGSIMFVLADHPKGHFYDLIIAANEIKKGASLQLTKIVADKGIEPGTPFIIYGSRESLELLPGAVLPGMVILLETPLTAKKLEQAMERIAQSLIGAEDRRRKSDIEALMARLASGDRLTNFPAQLESIYINSATNIQRYRKYAPWNEMPYLSLVHIYMGCNKYESAIPPAKTAIRLNPDCREAHRLLAQAYKKAGKSYEELEELLDLLNAEPNSAELLLKIGEAYLRQQEWKKAEEYLLKAISAYNPEEENRSRAKMHVGLGRAYAGEGEERNDQGRIQMARDQFQEAIRIYPLLMSAYNNLILVYKKLGHYEEAMKIMGRAVDITPDNAEDWVSLFEIFLIDGDQQKSRFCLQKALKYDPENQITLCTAAEIYVRQGMFQEAVGLFEKAVEVNPSDARLYNFLGICSRQLNRFELAIGYYRHALKLEPNDPGLHFNLGTACRHIGDLGMARTEYETALRLNPRFTEAGEALEQLREQGSRL